MTMLHGEHYTVETLDQFLNRTGFDYYDVARALQKSNKSSVEDIVASVNDVYDDDDVEFVPASSVDDLPKDEIQEFIGAYRVSTNNAIMATLEKDDRDWVHLYDGTVHDIVEVWDK